ncbi:MAG: acetyl-CoA carboxylase biotin carboxyl carrier protein [Oscillospiraceae bacterium]|nr:acetyl-CoA carboxylase biotin carboxyl carrier protein [Oscillospiraceae bacterium]
MFDNINSKFIDKMIDKMQKSGLGRIVVQQGDSILTLEAKKEVSPRYCVCAHHTDGAFPSNAAPAAKGSAAADGKTAVKEVTDGALKHTGNIVTSPTIGTFYTAPAPDKPSFAPVGTKVKKGDVLFIIESMKLMNEIKSEFDGTVVKVLANNGELIEYGQEVMIIE